MRATLCTLFLLLGATSFAQDEVHPFSIPNTRGASDLSVLAQEHLTAQRWDEAISVLQRIIDHMDDAEIVDGLAFFRSIERIVDGFED